MASLALGLVGSVLGNAALGTATILGLTGSQLGFFAGSLLGGILFPTDGPPDTVSEGPRITDNKLQTSTYGQYIPITYGMFRLAGNIIWASDLREVVTEETQRSGKGFGGGSSVTSKNYTYFRSFAIAICVGPIDRINKIWAGTTLIMDYSAGANTYHPEVYLGSESQGQSPTIASVEGIASTPAYRGIVYLVFSDFPLSEFGNAIPSFNIEVVKQVF